MRTIYGVKNGYRGFYSENLMTLDPHVVDSIQHKGGTILGTSRGGSEISKIVDSIQARGINQLYVIGGDGTQRGANAIYLEARARGIKVRDPRQALSSRRNNRHKSGFIRLSLHTPPPVNPSPFLFNTGRYLHGAAY